MGLSIGQIPASVAGLRSSPDFGRVRLRDDQGVPAARPFNPDDPQPLGFGKHVETVPRIGFGEGTLSPQGAALRTINRTVEELRKAQPSLAELRARFQATQQQGTSDKSTPNADVGSVRSAIQQIQRAIPEASGQARKFVQDIAAGAASAAARTGQGAAGPSNAGASVQIGDVRLAIPKPEGRPTIDVRV